MSEVISQIIDNLNEEANKIIETQKNLGVNNEHLRPSLIEWQIKHRRRADILTLSQISPEMIDDDLIQELNDLISLLKSVNDHPDVDKHQYLINTNNAQIEALEKHVMDLKS